MIMILIIFYQRISLLYVCLHVFIVSVVVRFGDIYILEEVVPFPLCKADMCCVESLVSRRLYAGARTGTVDPWFSSLKTEDVALLRFVWCNLRWYGLTFDHTRCTVCVTLEKHLVTCHRRGEPESA